LQDLELLAGVPLHLLHGEHHAVDVGLVHAAVDEVRVVESPGATLQLLHLEHPVLVQPLRYVADQESLPANAAAAAGGRVLSEPAALDAVAACHRVTSSSLRLEPSAQADQQQHLQQPERADDAQPDGKAGDHPVPVVAHHGRVGRGRGRRGRWRRGGVVPEHDWGQPIRHLAAERHEYLGELLRPGLGPVEGDERLGVDGEVGGNGRVGVPGLHDVGDERGGVVVFGRALAEDGERDHGADVEVGGHERGVHALHGLVLREVLQLGGGDDPVGVPRGDLVLHRRVRVG